MAFLTRIPTPARCRQGAAALAATLMLIALPATAANPVEREYDAAVRSFRTGRLAEAFGQFMALANRGDVDSARVALFMHSYGPTLYGKQWDAGPENVAYWNTLVRNSGTSARPMPEFQPTVLTPSKGPKAKPTPVRNRPGAEIASIAHD